MSGNTQIQVDDGQRVLLAACAQPGEVYTIETPRPGEIILRRVGARGNQARATYEEALRTIRNSKLEFTCGYDELRLATREV